jgi:hypothetical protein
VDRGPRSLAVGCVVVVGAALAGLISGRRVRFGAPEAAHVRRALTVVAVAAAAGGPLLIISVNPTAQGARAAVAALSATFVALAASAAAAVRRPPIGPARVVPLAALAVVGTAVAAVTVTGVDRGPALFVGAVVTGLLTVGTAALALASGRTALVKAGWAVAAALASLALTPVVVYAAIIPAMVLRALGGAEYPYSAAISTQPGVLLVVVPLAAAIAGWRNRDVTGANLRAPIMTEAGGRTG